MQIISDVVGNEKQVTTIRMLLFCFVVGLVLSGLTALPIDGQLSIAHRLIGDFGIDNSFTRWIELVYTGVHTTNANYPFISYGTDWLAFAHFVIAIAFVGPMRDPIKNIWVVEFGLIACLCIIPFAFVAGSIRGIPVYWSFIDCSFGIFGGALLWNCYKKIKKLELRLKREF